MSTSIWWIRRDLRLQDNTALASALEKSGSVIPLFILDPHLLNSPYNSPARTAFLFDSLRSLDAHLRERGSRLTVRQGDPTAVFHQLRSEIDFGAIFAEADFSPYARRRDKKVGQEHPLSLCSGLTVHPPETERKPDGTPYTVFTPFSKMWRSLPFPTEPLPAPSHLPPVPALVEIALPTLTATLAEALFTPNETEAQRRLLEFIATKIYAYADERNRMDSDGTSKLSPYLRFGLISARQAAWAAREAWSNAEDEPSRRSADTWLNELIWREFYLAILYHFPIVRENSFRSTLRNIPWRNHPGEFTAWTEGKTGYPIVDAAMRQLNSTGWMHNRTRMITASFLTKDLLIDWRWGERYFMQHLIDGDPASNNGGWQWTAGTGTDAAPYFRVFNPVLQSMKFDPKGGYIRRWVPELSGIPDEYLHAPWNTPLEIQKEAGCAIGTDYPKPVVDHRVARDRVVAAYQAGNYKTNHHLNN